MARRNKYAVLTHWLQQCDKATIKLTFDELNEIITIPPSAYRERPSWANCTTQNSTSFQRSWLNAGYRVTGISLQEQWVEFSKGDATVSPSKQTAMENTSNIPVAYEGSEPYVFISYAHKDTARVLPIIEALSASGFRIWYDAGIEAGTEWPEYIAAHLEKAACVIAFLSSASVASFNCRQEINYAIDLPRPLLAVYLEDLELTGGMRMRLGLSQAMFYHRHPTLDSFLSELSRSEMLAPCLSGDAGIAPSREKAPAFSSRPSTGASVIRNLRNDEFIIQNGILLEYLGKGGRVVIPEGVTVIGHGSFTGKPITEVIIPDSVCEIGDAAFQSCTELTGIRIPGSVKKIGIGVFFRCLKLSSVVLEEGIPLVANNMFALCEALRELIVPSSAKRVEAFSLFACVNLESIVFSDGLEVIESDSFSKCYSLKNVAIPTSVREIGARAFENCESLERAYIGKNTKYARVFGRSFPKNAWVIKN